MPAQDEQQQSKVTSCPYAVALQQRKQQEKEEVQQRKHHQWADNKEHAMTMMTTSRSMSSNSKNSSPGAGNVENVVEEDNKKKNETKIDYEIIQKCPAFEQGQCPFKAAKTAEDVRKMLLQVPPSHFNPSGSFYKVIQELHQVQHHHQNSKNDEHQMQQQQQQQPQVNKNSSSYTLPGGCPIRSIIVQQQSNNSSSGSSSSMEKVVSFREAMEGMSLAAIMAKMASQWEHEEEEQQQDISEESTNEDHGQSNVVKEDNNSGSNNEKKEKQFKDDCTSKDNKTSSTTIASSTTVTNDEGSKSQSLSFVTSLSSSSSSSSSRRLSESLKKGTAMAHQAAENVHFVRNFIRGKIDRTLYGQLIVMLYHVYVTLEESLNQYADQYFPTCHYPKQLQRTSTLIDDMDFWHGHIGTTISPTTRDYMNRIHYITQTNPLLLLAHSYTRYLGDLSGGRILARVAKKALQLDNDSTGLSFYEFEHISSPKQFKDMFRQSLDSLLLTNEQIEALVQEANVAFLLNMRLFEELDVIGNIPGATIRPLEDAINFVSLRQHGDNNHNVDDENNNANNTSSSSSSGNNNNVSHDSNHHNMTTMTTGKAKCPFANLGQTDQPTASNTTIFTAINPAVTSAVPHPRHHDAVAIIPSKIGKKGRCPWPFIFAHDPWIGLQDWQTWVVVGMILFWIRWKMIQ